MRPIGVECEDVLRSLQDPGQGTAIQSVAHAYLRSEQLLHDKAVIVRALFSSKQ